MRQTLPERAHLDHLKKQAKDLLDAHKRGEPEALARIREAVPAFAGKSDAAIAASPFALHDAQSAIAREYGHRSWADLRGAVEARAAQEPLSPEALRALLPLAFPAEVGALLQQAATATGRSLAAAVAQTALPSSLPLVPMRDALFLPKAVGPIHVARPSTHAAVVAGLARTPPTVAVFAQRSPADETPDAPAFHAVGCEAYVHARLADGPERAWVVLEGVRWLSLEAIDPGPGYRIARVRAAARDAGDATVIGPLAEALRAHARALASHFPDAERLVARINAAEPDHLADLIVANLPVSVQDKARYGAEARLVERLRIASTLAGLTPR